MTDNRRPASGGSVPPNTTPVKSAEAPATCALCSHFLVVDCYPDTPRYFCASEEAKDLVPRRHWLPGPDAVACQFLLPATSLLIKPPVGRLGLSLEERFISSPENFIDVKTTAYILHKSVSATYAIIDSGKLDHVRVGNTIYVYRPGTPSLEETEWKRLSLLKNIFVLKCFRIRASTVNRHRVLKSSRTEINPKFRRSISSVDEEGIPRLKEVEYGYT